MKNHQPRLRVVAWALHNERVSIGQADFPAREFEPLIRMAEIGMMLAIRLVLAFDNFIGLIAVEQRRSSCVKIACPRWGAALCGLHKRQPAHAQHGNVVFLPKILCGFSNIERGLIA
jgi:hypothetical protein